MTYLSSAGWGRTAGWSVVRAARAAVRRRSIPPRPGHGWASGAGPYVLLAIASAVWYLSLSGIDEAGMNDFGLISVLPPTLLVAIGLVVLGAVAQLTDARPNPIAMTLYLIVAVVMLYGIPAFIDQVARNPVNWIY